MESPPTENDATEDLAIMVHSSVADGVPSGDITCGALQLALCAIHIDMAWHAGAITAEASMEALDREIGRTTSRYNGWARATASETVNRAPSNRTPAQQVTAFVGNDEYESVSRVKTA